MRYIYKKLNQLTLIINSIALPDYDDADDAVNKPSTVDHLSMDL